jgi:uncharacterized protein (TIGR03086 family)
MTTDEQNGPALMSAAAAETARVVGNVNAGELDRKTPCADWDLRTLLNHTILWTAYSAEQRAYGKSVAEDLMSKDFAAAPGFAADYQAQVARAVQAWSDPKAWAGGRSVMGSETPATDIAAMLIAEMVLHGWDIARATGQDYQCSQELANELLQTVETQGEMFRQYQGFAAIVQVPDSADAFDRALSLSGRDPAWKPGN